MILWDRLQLLTDIYDLFHNWWERPSTQRLVAALTLLAYLAALSIIEAKRLGLLPPQLARLTPDSHIWAIHLAFTIILFLEVMGLIFSISSSFSRAVGKQLEIMALILLRNAFKELGHLAEPITVAGQWQPVMHIAIYASGALGIFILMRLFLGTIRHRHYISKPSMRMRYVMSKKLLSLLLLLMVLGISIRDLVLFWQTGESQHFFETIYTVLIFADITLVLIAQRYMPTFQAVFRNSGYVLGTLMMRLGLSASAPLDTAISLFAGFYVLALVWALNRFGQKAGENGK